MTLVKALMAKSAIDFYYQLCYVRNIAQEGDWKLLLFACHFCGGVLVIFSIMDAHVLRYHLQNFPALYIKHSPHKVSNFPDIQTSSISLKKWL